MPKNYFNSRKEPRYPIIKRVTYTSVNAAGDVSHGLAVNISNSGLCLHVYKPLEVGETITINEDLPTTCQKVIARWIRKTAKDFYIAGFQCISLI